MPIYDVFHCRDRYIALVGPHYSRVGLGSLKVLADEEPLPVTMLADPRSFTMTAMAELPNRLRDKDEWIIEIRSGSQGLQRWPVGRICAPRGTVALATLVKFDWPYIAEWIMHHHALGVEHFYIYNNGEAKITHAIARFIGAVVTEIDWPHPYGWTNALVEPCWTEDSHVYCQCPQQMHAALKFGRQWEWMGFFDADEFLMPGKSTAGLREILCSARHGTYSELPFTQTYSAIVQGKWFGTSGHKTIPPGSVLENYTRCERGHTSGTKCFVRPEYVTASAVHYWYGDGQAARIPDNVLRFNHYRSLSGYKNRVGPEYDSDWSNEDEA